MAHTETPVIATGKVFASYLDAARTNLERLVELANALRDEGFACEGQFILDQFDGLVSDARLMIAEAA